MKLSSDEAVKIAVNFDNLVRQGLTTNEQIDFLIDNYEQLGVDTLLRNEDYNNLNINNDTYMIDSFHPLTALFDSSAFALEIYRPENLVGLTIQQLATLAHIFARLHVTPKLHGTRPDADSKQQTIISLRYTAIVEATHILPRETRALFCAAQMTRPHWTKDRLIFINSYKNMCYRALSNEKPLPEYPRGFCGLRFYSEFNSSYASKLPQILADAISADDPAQFNILLTLSNLKLEKKLLLHLINENAIKIILDNFDAVTRFLSIDTLAFYCASSLHRQLADPLLKQIEKSFPGTLRNVRDIFGNNALWYLLYHDGNFRGSYYFSKIPSIKTTEALLLKHGCDPNQANCLDLTYNSIRTAQKELNHFD